MKKAMISVLLILLLTITCTKKQKEQGIDDSINYKPASGDWLVRRLGSEPAHLNPITSSDAYESLINGYILETLIERDNETLEFKPLLCDTWTISEDKLKYTFYLKKDVYWHTGEPFTAYDVLFSYNKIQDPKVDAAHLRNYYRDIKNVQVIDTYTIKFTYGKLYFRALDFCGGIPIVPRHIFKEGDFNSHKNNRFPIGTGPYKFLKWESNKEIILVRNEDYWGEKPKIKRIIFKIVKDSTVALQLLKKEELDFIGLEAIQWTRQTNSKRFKRIFNKISYPSRSYRYIGWNLRKPLFSDKRVRWAMAHIINREVIVEKIKQGLAVPISSPFHINDPVCDKSLKLIEYDVNKAKKLLDEAGWVDTNKNGIRDKNGIEFKFEFLIPSGRQIYEQIGSILKENLKSLNIEVEIRKLEWATFTQMITDHKFDAYCMGWTQPVDADPFQVWHSSQAERGSNYQGFVNKEADILIEKARQEFNRTKRNEYYKRLQQILYEEQPYLFLFTEYSLVAIHKRFKNVKKYPLGFDTLEWWVPDELQKYRN